MLRIVAYWVSPQLNSTAHDKHVISHPLLRKTFKYVKQLKTFRINEAIFNNLIQNRTVHRQTVQRNEARAKNNSVGQKEDPRNFQKKKGNGKLPRPLFMACFFHYFCFCKMYTIVFL